MIFSFRRPTRGEAKVLMGAVAIPSFILGVAGIVSGMEATPEKHELAQQAIHYGIAAIICGMIFAGSCWALARFEDSP